MRRRAVGLPDWNLFTYINQQIVAAGKISAAQILAAFDSIVIASEKSYPEFSEVQVKRFLLYEQEYKIVYSINIDLLTTISKALSEVVAGAESKPFSYNTYDYIRKKIYADIYSLNRNFIKQIINDIEKALQYDFKELLEGLQTELLEDTPKYKEWDPIELSFDIIYEAIQNQLKGSSLEKEVRKGRLYAFKCQIYMKKYSSEIKRFVPKGDFLLSCENNLVTWQSQRNHGIHSYVFTGYGGYKDFFVGLSEYETGSTLPAKWWEPFYTNCSTPYTEYQAVEGSPVVESIAFWKKGKVVLKFKDWRAAVGFMDFCRRC